jgi:hypothetical protein
MKFTCFQTRHLGLILGCCVVVSACNKEDFFKAEEFLVGKDAYCFQEGPDLASCQAMGDECRAAYQDAEDESLEPVFAMCIANPDYSPNDGSVAGGTDGGSVAGGTDGGSVAGGTDGGSVAGGTDGGSVAGGTDGGSVAGGTDGGSVAGGTDGGGSDAGGTNGGGSNAGGSNGGSGNGDVSEVPTLDEAFKSKCKNLDPKYLWTKNEVTKSGTKTTSKVKVCHQTGNASFHTIVIACPALKAHVKHDDYLGICEE